MNESELEHLERDLGQLRPARIPDALHERLKEIKPSRAASKRSSGMAWPEFQLPFRRWAVPMSFAGLMVAALAGWMAARLPSQRSGTEPPVRANVETRDTVQIDRELVAVYDAVARLPGGERVRFRCREWRDQIVVSDPLRGMVIEQSTPTLDVVPIRFETY